MIKEANKRNGSQIRARMSDNQTKKCRYSSWLIEAASYGAEPVEPDPNQFIRLIKNPKFSQKVPKWLRKQTKETVLNSEPGWVRTRQRKVSVPHGWQRLPAMVLNRLVKNPKFGQKVPKWLRKQTTTIMCGPYCLHPSNTIFISKGRKDDEEREKAYEDEEDKL